MTVDKAALLTKRPLPERDVEIPGVGTVRVRGLTRAEAFSLQSVAADAGALEVKVLSAAMLDPKLTEDEVRAWQASSAYAEINPISEAITELSGMGTGADKAAMLAFRGDAGA